MTKFATTTAAELAEYFQFMDELRESGVVNMYASGPYLQEEFDLSRSETAEVWSAWTSTFSREVSAADRARAAFEERAA